MKCKRCKKELDYETPGEVTGRKDTAMAEGAKPFYVVSLQMQGIGWNEQHNVYLCSKCYDEVKKDVMGRDK